MRRTVIDGNKYIGVYVVPSYKFQDGNYKETQIIARSDGSKKDRYIDFGSSCLVKVEEGDVVINARHFNGKTWLQITRLDANDVVEINGIPTFGGKILFEGTVEEYEKKRTLRQYDNAVVFACGNLHSITGGFYVTNR